MKWEDIHKLIKDSGGTIEYGINWTWAYWPKSEEETAKSIFNEIDKHTDNRGFYPSCNNDCCGFRFR